AEGCSNWSTPRYLDVGRQAKDLNGDGFADVVLRDSGKVVGRGRVLVMFGPTLEQRVVLEDSTLPVDQADGLGAIPAQFGDLDADGFSDLVLSAEGDASSMGGKALVFFGAAEFGSNALATARRITDDSSPFFGSLALMAGDTDADGYRDLLLGW